MGIFASRSNDFCVNLHGRRTIRPCPGLIINFLFLAISLFLLAIVPVNSISDVETVALNGSSGLWLAVDNGHLSRHRFKTATIVGLQLPTNAQPTRHQRHVLEANFDFHSTAWL